MDGFNLNDIPDMNGTALPVQPIYSTQNSIQKSGKKRILTLDGGGVRGLVSALILAELEKRTGKPIAEQFDLIVGTSTGGIIAPLLCVKGVNGTPKYTAQDIVTLYATKAADIFSGGMVRGLLIEWQQNIAELSGKSDAASLKILGNILTGLQGILPGAKYNEKKMIALLTDMLGDAKLSDTLSNLMVTATDLERNDLHLFKNWRAQGRSEDIDSIEKREKINPKERDYKLVDVVRATSAAPSFFEPARVKNMAGDMFALVDGGLIANNPSLAAITSARRLWPLETEIHLVSVGTGACDKPILYQDAKGKNGLWWLPTTMRLLFNGAVKYSQFIGNELLGRSDTPHQFFRLDPMLCSFPKDPQAANEDMDDTRPQNIERLMTKTQDFIAKNDALFSDVINHLNADPTVWPPLKVTTPNTYDAYTSGPGMWHI